MSETKERYNTNGKTVLTDGKIVLSPLIDDLMDYCAKWQKRLRLQDWRIYIKVSRSRDMSNKGAVGEVAVSPRHQSAFIDIQDPVDVLPDNTYPYNPEKTIIHELLHCLLDPLGNGEPASDAVELVIEKLSTCLYNMEYGVNPETQGEYREVQS